jgi:hypothetical protein
MIHSFHIPVLGLAYSVSTPFKVAKYGISSVASIVDDILVEEMRKHYSKVYNKFYAPITPHDEDSRARRITAYCNLMQDVVDEQFADLKQQPFLPHTDITRYFDLLPENNPLKQLYLEMLDSKSKSKKEAIEANLRASIKPGSIDVNIMSKVDKNNVNAAGEALEAIYSDALASLRGFANSKLESSIILSAGMNPRLYSYLEEFSDFYPDANGYIKKKLVLKVSDYRSAVIQGKFLAKKGIWVSEFRVESGLNCGGHAFATNGLLMGPILEEFKTKRQEIIDSLFEIYQKALIEKGLNLLSAPDMYISAQGGIGTFKEDAFLREYYELESTGWGSPFLLVPETTEVDDDTLQRLVGAQKSDFYISNSSPLGVPFSNFRNTTTEEERLNRIKKGNPGSPCKKKFLVSNTEFGPEPICLASRQYQHLKINQLNEQNLPKEEHDEQFKVITDKICLCEGLATSAYIKNDINRKEKNTSVAICPGPNIAYFNRVFTLDEMVGHIYGKWNLISGSNRPNVFVNELNLYVDYLVNDIKQSVKNLNDKKVKYLAEFKNQLLHGIDYYKELIPKMNLESLNNRTAILKQFQEIEYRLRELQIQQPVMA